MKVPQHRHRPLTPRSQPLQPAQSLSLRHMDQLTGRDLYQGDQRISVTEVSPTRSCRSAISYKNSLTTFLQASTDSNPEYLAFVHIMDFLYACQPLFRNPMYYSSASKLRDVSALFMLCRAAQEPFRKSMLRSTRWIWASLTRPGVTRPWQ